MEFASKHVYAQAKDDDSDEEIDEDVLDAAGEMGVARFVSFAAQQQQQQQPHPQQAQAAAANPGTGSSIAIFFSGLGGPKEVPAPAAPASAVVGGAAGGAAAPVAPPAPQQQAQS